MTYYLTAQYDRHKQFYRKAAVNVFLGTLTLFSYKTVVAKIYKEKGIAEVYNLQSPTTLRHVMEFLKQNGFKAESRAQIVRDYVSR